MDYVIIKSKDSFGKKVSSGGIVAGIATILLTDNVRKAIIFKSYEEAIKIANTLNRQFRYDAPGNSLFGFSVVPVDTAKKMLVKGMLIRKEPINESLLGHHHYDGNDIYVDSNFINVCQDALPGSKLEHLGMGEFVLKLQDGEIEFDRLRGKPFDKMVGRPHQMYDNKNGKLVKKLIVAMEKKKKSVLIEYSHRYGMIKLTELISEEEKTLNVNDILVSKWGYEQTNVDFYKVIAIKNKFATIRKLENKETYNSQAMTGTAVPTNKFVDSPIRRKITTKYNGDPMIKLKSYAFAYLWDGTPERFSTYG